jgi:cytoskeleton protein RodZ
MKTVGQILKKNRQEKGVSLAEIEKATKIRLGNLRALEEDEYEKLPSLTSARGFIKNYAEFLGLSSTSLLAIFRRDFTQDKRGRVIPQIALKPLDKPFLSWSPRLTIILLAAGFFSLFFGYLLYQYFSLINPPRLTLTAPLPEEQVTGETIEVVGKTSADAVVTVNGQIVNLSEEGEFRYQLKLASGRNTIVVEAVNKQGKKSEVGRTVYAIE